MTQGPAGTPVEPPRQGLLAAVVARLTAGQESNSISALAMGCFAVVILCLGMAVYYHAIVARTVFVVIAILALILAFGLLAQRKAVIKAAAAKADDKTGETEALS